MNITSKQRATLRGLASKIETIGQIGKGNISEDTIKFVSEALTKRELIKLRVLETSEGSPREVANELAMRTDSIVVATVGSKVILYKKNHKDPKIDI